MCRNILLHIATSIRLSKCLLTAISKRVALDIPAEIQNNKDSKRDKIAATEVKHRILIRLKVKLINRCNWSKHFLQTCAQLRLLTHSNHCWQHILLSSTVSALKLTSCILNHKWTHSRRLLCRLYLVKHFLTCQLHCRIKPIAPDWVSGVKHRIPRVNFSFVLFPNKLVVNLKRVLRRCHHAFFIFLDLFLVNQVLHFELVFASFKVKFALNAELAVPLIVVPF